MVFLGLGEALGDHLDYAPVGRRADGDPLVRVGPVDELDGALPGSQDVALGQVRVLRVTREWTRTLTGPVLLAGLL